MDGEARFLADTDILIRHFRQKRAPSTLEAAVERYGLPIVSEVTLFELKVGALRGDRGEDLGDILIPLEIVVVDYEVWMMAASIQAYLLEHNLQLELSDILIGATALVNNWPLLTGNLRHFERIPDLKLLSLPPR